MDASTQDEFKRGLDHFDPEGRVFPAIALKVAAGQELTKKDVLLILKWKLGRIKASNYKTVSDRSISSINEAVKSASEESCWVRSLVALDAVPGIGLPTATAILTVCYPDQFTILDWRVLESLRLYPSRLMPAEARKYDSADWTAKEYVEEFLPQVKERSRIWNSSLRAADQALWGLSVERWHEQVINFHRVPAERH